MPVAPFGSPTRRTVFGLGAALLGTSALAGCSSISNLFNGKNQQQIAQLVLTYAADVANGLANVATNIAGLPAATTAAVTAYAKDAEAAAAALNASMSQTAAQPIIVKIQTDVAAVSGAIAGFATSPTVATILKDINLVLGVALPLVGLLVPVAATRASAAEVAGAEAHLHTLPRVQLH
jgi:hypothetical protein